MGASQACQMVPFAIVPAPVSVMVAADIHRRSVSSRRDERIKGQQHGRLPVRHRVDHDGPNPTALVALRAPSLGFLQTTRYPPRCNTPTVRRSPEPPLAATARGVLTDNPRLLQRKEPCPTPDGAIHANTTSETPSTNGRACTTRATVMNTILGKEQTENLSLGRRRLGTDTVFEHEHFANGGIAQCRDDSPALSEVRQAGTGTQRVIENLQGGLW